MTTGSLTNHLMAQQEALQPEVGMGVTELCWTDRHAYTIVKIVSPKKVVIQRDTATRIDSNGMSDSQSYEYTPNPNGATFAISLRNNGKWYRVGFCGNVFQLGLRMEYYDYSF